MNCSTPGFSVLHHLLEFAQTHVHWVDDVIQSSHPLSPPSPPAFSLPQNQGLFQWIGSSHQVVKVLELQLQHSLSNGYSGLISFRIDWFGLLAVQGTLKSLLKHHSSTASILRSSAFFTAQEEPPLCRRLFLSSSLGTLAHPLAQIFLQGSLPLRTAQSWSLISS